ncbi:uncharacterized protein A1O9_10763 [Exophiala aquamarina CBS 119918]|uniref:methionyl-tRNA formyltransferase n=1 Tax=Exophiala aquamarina CBS 119918 TaxID=1182545 RepID=A0A072PCP6_9EURO|nr:uncharacterized protein A1O9_10763 [Exophiala aquamarina CBS 119918]KEF53315.1 hypothetical protein A1O9_10763 [Exophiala aquamarina CBS 119918]
MRPPLSWLPRRIAATWSRKLTSTRVQQQTVRWISSIANEKHSAPLRILFCGSDTFSTASLKALHEESKSADSIILSIDVVTRKDKYIGRGNKILSKTPLGDFAENLELPVHKIDTFTGWQPPVYDSSFNSEINLIVAVSFGLLIPMRIINGATYGGLNVHPSMLPNLRGAAPIRWAIMNGLTHTGVSVQTLHPTKFDGGIVLAQTPYPGLQIPDKDNISPNDLTKILAPMGSELLIDVIRNKLYVPPYEAVPSTLDESGIMPAPKFTRMTQAIDFQTMSRDAILRRNRATGRSNLLVGAKPLGSVEELTMKVGKTLRLPTGHDVPSEIQDELLTIPKGLPYALADEEIDSGILTNPLIVNVTPDQPGRPSQLVIPDITIPSKRQDKAASAAFHANLFRPDPVKIGPYQLWLFGHPLSYPTL